MRKIFPAIALASALVLSTQAHAFQRAPDGMIKKCTLSDAWTGPDKTKHALGGALIGSSVTAATKRTDYGIWATVAVAGLKEVVDRRGYGTCSFQDFAVTVAAGAVGAYTTNWLIIPEPKGITVAYTKQF